MFILRVVIEKNKIYIYIELIVRGVMWCLHVYPCNIKNYYISLLKDIKTQLHTDV